MYKITLKDCNVRKCFSGLVTYYCDDIDKFEKEWSKLVEDGETIRHFKEGEAVTNFYYTDNDEPINMVQEDKDAKVFFEKDITVRDRIVKLENANAYVAEYFVKEINIHIKYARYAEKYIRIMTYSIHGIAKFCNTEEYKYGKSICYGNPVLKWIDNNKKRPFSNRIEDFFEDRIEAIVYYPTGYFDTLEEMEKSYRRNDISDDELSFLLNDIMGA